MVKIYNTGVNGIFPLSRNFLNVDLHCNTDRECMVFSRPYLDSCAGNWRVKTLSYPYQQDSKGSQAGGENSKDTKASHRAYFQAQFRRSPYVRYLPAIYCWLIMIFALFKSCWDIVMSEPP